MPLRNRVTPLGELVAHPERGLVFGNRGCLHDREGRIRRAFDGKRWIACRLEFKERRRSPLLRPGRYTELFFLDEATAFAAGHRPCAECRRADYVCALDLAGARAADELDARLHEERLAPRVVRDPRTLPDGAFVLVGGEPHVVARGALHRWTPAGYDATREFEGPLETITPPTLVDVLATGWRGVVPLLHPSVDAWTS